MILIYTDKWRTLKSTDRHNWLVGAILSLAESQGKRDDVYVDITSKFRSVMELEEYYHKLEEQS